MRKQPLEHETRQRLSKRRRFVMLNRYGANVVACDGSEQHANRGQGRQRPRKNRLRTTRQTSDTKEPKVRVTAKTPHIKHTQRILESRPVWPSGKGEGEGKGDFGSASAFCARACVVGVVVCTAVCVCGCAATATAISAALCT